MAVNKFFYAATVVDAGTWATASSATGSTASTYATNTGTTQNQEYPMDLGFNFASEVSPSATITSWLFAVYARANVAARTQIGAAAYLQNGAIQVGGPTLAFATLGTTNSGYSWTPTLISTADLVGNTLISRIICKRTSSSAATASVDYTYVSLNWTTPPPNITQDAYQFTYDSDGSPLALKDTPATLNVYPAGDVLLDVRIRLQLTSLNVLDPIGAVKIQYEKNNSGTWLSPTAGTGIAPASTSFNDAYITSPSLGTGTGTWGNGKITYKAPMAPTGITVYGNGYTEMQYVIKVERANVAHGDTFKFRVVYNDSSASMTYTKTPTLSIVNTPLPKTSTVIDSFNTQINKSRWLKTTAEPYVTWDAGRARLTTLWGTDVYMGVSSAGGYDLTSSHIYARMWPPTDPEQSFWLRISPVPGATGTYIHFLVTGAATPQLTIYEYVSDVSTSTKSINYDPVNHAWLKVRESGGTIYYSTSPDGLSWTDIHSHTAGFTVSNVSFAFWAWHDFSGDDLYGWVDNVNTPTEVAEVTGGKPSIWTGSAHVAKPGKLWGGSVWTEKPWKYWTGTEWKLVK